MLASSTSTLGIFFSVAMTAPFVAVRCQRAVPQNIRRRGGDLSILSTKCSAPLMPMDVVPADTALSAYSIWISLPEGLRGLSTEHTHPCDHLNVVSPKE